MGPGFCTSSLAPEAAYAISVTYTASSSARGLLTLDLTNDYFPSATRTLVGTATNRALLTIGDSPWLRRLHEQQLQSGLDLDLPGHDRAPRSVRHEPGSCRSPRSRWPHRLARPSLGAEALSLAATVASLGARPERAIPYCSTAMLGVGQQCALSLTFTPPDGGIYTGAVNLAYSWRTAPRRDLRDSPGDRCCGTRRAGPAPCCRSFLPGSPGSRLPRANTVCARGDAAAGRPSPGSPPDVAREVRPSPARQVARG